MATLHPEILGADHLDVAEIGREAGTKDVTDKARAHHSVWPDGRQTNLNVTSENLTGLLLEVTPRPKFRINQHQGKAVALVQHSVSAHLQFTDRRGFCRQGLHRD
jgi:hypothetical protein